jgi:hypothetical protein
LPEFCARKPRLPPTSPACSTSSTSSPLLLGLDFLLRAV